MTKREMFEVIRDYFVDHCAEDEIIAEEDVTAQVVIDFCDTEIETLAKRAAGARARAEKKRDADTATVEMIYECVDEADVNTVNEIVARAIEADPEMTRAKVINRLGKLAKAERLEKVRVKVPDEITGKNKEIVGYKRV